MTNPNKTKEQLQAELADLRQETVALRQQLAEMKMQRQEQKQREEALQLGQTRLAGILDMANEAIIVIDENQQIILFNQGAQKIFGYAPDEVIGKSLDLLIPARLQAAHREHIAAFAQAPETARSMGERGQISGRRKSGQTFPAAASISKIALDDKLALTVILRDITEQIEWEQKREERINELRSLNEAAQLITAELSLEQVLQEITQAAHALLNVKYAALGIHDKEGRLTRFVTAGVSPEQKTKIGPLPVGQGLLGMLMHRGQSIIVHDIESHPRSVGFPENHPEMHTLLGVPIYAKDKLLGALYLSDKKDGRQFSERDKQLVEMLALHAAIALENAHLYEQTQRLAILEERDRFARDLHDGIIQSIYAVGLALDQAKLDIQADNHSAQQQIEISLKRLAAVIQDIRNYIFDLRPHALKYKGLKGRLEGLIKELKVNTLLLIEANIEPQVESCLTDTQTSHLFHICHEALSNAARHAKPNHIRLELTREEDQIRVVVADNGQGFNPQEIDSPQPGHRGLVNMQTRAVQMGATLQIDSQPGRGTKVTLVLRCGASSAPQ